MKIVFCLPGRTCTATTGITLDMYVESKITPEKAMIV